MALIGWLVAGATMLAVLYGLQGDLSMEHPMPVQVAALYNSVARDAWAVSVAWVILACLSGWGGQYKLLIHTHLNRAVVEVSRYIIN